MEGSSLVSQRKYDRMQVVMGDAPIVNNLDADLVKCSSSGEGFGVVVLLPKDDFPEESHELNTNTFIIEKVDGYMGIRLDRIVKNKTTN